MRPSTPLKVLEERRKKTIEVVKKIEYVEALCAKVVEQFSQTWEALIDDEELEKVAEELITPKMEINQMRNEMKKFPLAKKLAKVEEMKKPHQQVTMLKTQQQ